MGPPLIFSILYYAENKSQYPNEKYLHVWRESKSSAEIGTYHKTATHVT